MPHAAACPAVFERGALDGRAHRRAREGALCGDRHRSFKGLVALGGPSTGKERPGHVDQPVGRDALQPRLNRPSDRGTDGGFAVGESARADLSAATEEVRAELPREQSGLNSESTGFVRGMCRFGEAPRGVQFRRALQQCFDAAFLVGSERIQTVRFIECPQGIRDSPSSPSTDPSRRNPAANWSSSFVARSCFAGGGQLTRRFVRTPQIHERAGVGGSQPRQLGVGGDGVVELTQNHRADGIEPQPRSSAGRPAWSGTSTLTRMRAAWALRSSSRADSTSARREYASAYSEGTAAPPLPGPAARSRTPPGARRRCRARTTTLRLVVDSATASGKIATILRSHHRQARQRPPRRPARSVVSGVELAAIGFVCAALGGRRAPRRPTGTARLVPWRGDVRRPPSRSAPTPPFWRDGGSGSTWRTASEISLRLAPWNGTTPVRHS